jgi:hypothetical protein
MKLLPPFFFLPIVYAQTLSTSPSPIVTTSPETTQTFTWHNPETTFTLTHVAWTNIITPTGTTTIKGSNPTESTGSKVANPDPISTHTARNGGIENSERGSKILVLGVGLGTVVGCLIQVFG